MKKEATAEKKNKIALTEEDAENVTGAGWKFVVKKEANTIVTSINTEVKDLKEQLKTNMTTL